jgi:prepilin-type N-terminal cleavage/methylation domain-containing protein
MVEPGASQGFSLAEMMIVIACTAILLAAAVPNMAHLQKEWVLWNSAKSVEVSLQWGRMQAIASNAPLLFEIDESRRKFYWVDPESGQLYANSIRQLSGAILITAFPRRPLRFYQHGNAAPAGTYTIEGEAGSYSVVVSPGGRIRFQRN